MVSWCSLLSVGSDHRQFSILQSRGEEGGRCRVLSPDCAWCVVGEGSGNVMVPGGAHSPRGSQAIPPTQTW